MRRGNQRSILLLDVLFIITGRRFYQQQQTISIFTKEIVYIFKDCQSVRLEKDKRRIEKEYVQKEEGKKL